MFKSIQKLITPDELKTVFPPDLAAKQERDQAIKAILEGRDPRRLLIMGPCSLDSLDGINEYLERILPLAERVKNKLFFVPRLFTAKPRSRLGFRGLAHCENGIFKSREILFEVQKRFGLTGADELLYPSLYPYFDDFISYASVGARSSDNQEHRLFASGLDIAAGIKNSLGGNLNNLSNSVFVAQSGGRLFANNHEVETSGNPFAHAILRGYTDNEGKKHINCDKKSVLEFVNLCPSPIVADLSHDNSFGGFEAALDGLKDSVYAKNVCGFMLESYVYGGNAQKNGAKVGRSITDICLDIKQTERVVLELCSAL